MEQARGITKRRKNPVVPRPESVASRTRLDASKTQPLAGKAHYEVDSEVEVEVEVDPDTDRFGVFWKAYPRKVGKPTAQKAWGKINPTQRLLDNMLTALEKQKKSLQWTKDEGQFIPHPATWLNREGWNDSAEVEILDDGIPQGDPHNMAVLRRILNK